MKKSVFLFFKCIKIGSGLHGSDISDKSLITNESLMKINEKKSRHDKAVISSTQQNPPSIFFVLIGSQASHPATISFFSPYTFNFF